MEPLTLDKIGLRWLYTGFILLAGICCVSVVMEFFWIFLLLPVVLVVLTGIYHLDKLMLFSVVVTPLSINLARTGLGIGVSLPSEPLIFGIMLAFILKICYDNREFSKLVIYPVGFVIILHLVWMCVTTLTSSMVLVSFKSTLARICFVMVFFFMGAMVFKKLENIRAFLWCYMIPLVAVVLYTTAVHAASGFTEKVAHTAMVPFYNDHTAYAAAIAMFVPALFGLVGDTRSSVLSRSLAGAVLVLFITAIVLSYTRASWISLAAALLCYLVFLFRIKTSIVLTGIISVVVMFFFFQTQIVMTLEQTEEQSSTDYASHVQSMSNISTDASNVERINRWNSAFRMWEERPFFGWGPGTYMFQYAPFQKWSERTIISTNFGEGGNAHSEYIGPLAEQGILGSVTTILILIVVIYRASRLIMAAEDKTIRMLAKGLVLGLVTYWVHGMLNNFLDTEKAAVPFWGFIGALTALDIYHWNNDASKSSKVIS